MALVRDYGIDSVSTVRPAAASDRSGNRAAGSLRTPTTNAAQRAAMIKEEEIRVANLNEFLSYIGVSQTLLSISTNDHTIIQVELTLVPRAPDRGHSSLSANPFVTRSAN